MPIEWMNLGPTKHLRHQVTSLPFPTFLLRTETQGPKGLTQGLCSHWGGDETDHVFIPRTAGRHWGISSKCESWTWLGFHFAKITLAAMWTTDQRGLQRDEQRCKETSWPLRRADSGRLQYAGADKVGEKWMDLKSTHGVKWIDMGHVWGGESRVTSRDCQISFLPSRNWQ